MFGSAALLCAVAALAARTRRVTLGLTGDVNLPEGPIHGAAARQLWGDTLPVLRNLSALLINHESTLNSLPDPQPNSFKYEDKAVAAFRAAGVAWVGQANNHQFDFWGGGVNGTIGRLESAGLTFGGLGTPDAVRRPQLLVLPDRSGGAPVRVAVFSLVAQLCHKHQGEDVMTSCTCGVPSSYPTMPPLQCYAANHSAPGLWYLPHPITDEAIAEAAGVVRRYAQGGEADVIVAYLHAGPNFEWQPAEDRERLLRNLSDAGADVVWGTSSHHMQRMESRCGRPVIYGIGDLLFRFVPGVDKPETCEKYMAPCQQFRPELSAVVEVEFELPAQRGAARVGGITAHVTRHNATAVRLGNSSERVWVRGTFNRISAGHGARMVDDAGVLRVVLAPSHPSAGAC